jgi:5-methylcytosine-specific restriction endonuclease McrBC regulatory subunit McrC
MLNRHAASLSYSKEDLTEKIHIKNQEIKEVTALIQTKQENINRLMQAASTVQNFVYIQDSDNTNESARRGLRHRRRQEKKSPATTVCV